MGDFSCVLFYKTSMVGSIDIMMACGLKDPSSNPAWEKLVWANFWTNWNSINPGLIEDHESFWLWILSATLGSSGILYHTNKDNMVVQQKDLVANKPHQF